MKIALAQINPTIGAFDGNFELIRGAIEQARNRGADLVVFPEMASSGYPPLDLLERRLFVEANLELVRRTAEICTGIGAIVGHVRWNPKEGGKPLENVASLLAEGRIVSTHAKMLLPTYDVFDERRYFEPAERVQPVEFLGVRLGILICEDIWNVPGYVPDGLYERDPVAELKEGGAELIINLSASPYDRHKRLRRPEMLSEVARSHCLPVVFVNQVGGNDDLIFDGRSGVYDADGREVVRARTFETDLVLCDYPIAAEQKVAAEATDEETSIIDALSLGIKDYSRKCGFRSAVIGLSGGIDSAVVAALAVRAFGPENVLGVAMPTRYSSAGSLTDAEQLANNLGIGYTVQHIDDLFQGFLDHLEPVFEGHPFDVTEENIQARIRGVVLMALSNKMGHLLLTTGNKSEMAVGYSTLYGDMAGGLAPLADVPKTMVFRISEAFNREGELIPRAIIDKPPSAELREDQQDQDSLPPYAVLDAILDRYIDFGEDAEAIVARGFDEKLTGDVIRLVRHSEYKRRQAPPGLKISHKAFGFGRRIPIAQRW